MLGYSFDGTDELQTDEGNVSSINELQKPVHHEHMFFLYIFAVSILIEVHQVDEEFCQFISLNNPTCVLIYYYNYIFISILFTHQIYVSTLLGASCFNHKVLFALASFLSHHFFRVVSRRKLKSPQGNL